MKREINAEYIDEARANCALIRELSLDLAKALIDDDYYEKRRLESKIDHAIEELVTLVHDVWGYAQDPEEDAA